MSRSTTSKVSVWEPAELHTGDRMSRDEFHRIYEQTPEDFKAELIGGIVYVASPLRRSHGTHHAFWITLFGTYAGRTPGVEVSDNTTLLLGEDSEPQPDLYLRILPEYGGQSSTDKQDYVVGAPELVAEVAHSSRAIDLHAKRDDYARYGVREYLVLSLRDRRLHWIDLIQGIEREPDRDGIVRVQTFPGLWINRDALLAQDYGRLMESLEQGLATPEHAAFAASLAQARTSRGEIGS
jgi:Uma2 family endonuclease